ncbi:UpxY family transcription antiterminator [Puia sp.]|jgi:transcription antitermination factor NusG|uniref:UpxY family transcription antiterminator n=1 Tax=Puia sp. TaxID=2045100 RepID=UPI002F423452
MPENKRNWYAIYTRPRWEKKVYALLVESGLETYCPLNKVRKKWSDRIKWVEEPLFKSYLFVKINEDKMTVVRQTGGVVNFVYWLGKPALVRDKEIESIRKFLDEYRDVRVEPVDLQADTVVSIRGGAFMDRKGRIMKVLNNRVQVLIESIGFRLVAVLEKSNITVIGKR